MIVRARKVLLLVHLDELCKGDLLVRVRVVHHEIGDTRLRARYSSVCDGIFNVERVTGVDQWVTQCQLLKNCSQWEICVGWVFAPYLHTPRG